MDCPEPQLLLQIVNQHPDQANGSTIFSRCTVTHRDHLRNIVIIDECVDPLVKGCVMQHEWRLDGGRFLRKIAHAYKGKYRRVNRIR